MFGTREFRFSYTDKNGELQYLHTRNIYLATKIVAERGGSNCQRAPISKPKATPDTHCQICGREILAKTGLIAHHGYQRPGHGWQTASCFGARYRPYEVACDALPPAIEGLSSYIERVKENLADWQANPPATITYYKDEWRGPYRASSKEKVVLERPADFDPKAEGGYFSASDYARRYHSQLGQMEREIRAAKQDLTRLQQRLADWRAPK